MSLAMLQSFGDDDLVDQNTILSTPSGPRAAPANENDKPTGATIESPTAESAKEPAATNGFHHPESAKQASPPDTPKAADYASASPPAQPITNGSGDDRKAPSIRNSVAQSDAPASFYTAQDGATVRAGSTEEKHSLRSPSLQTGAPSELPPSAKGTFATGAGASGPRAPPDDDLHTRATVAEHSVGGDILRRLTKREAKDAKRFSKVLKNEGKTEQKTLDVALKELERLQKVQRKAAAAEAEALAKHTKASRQETKLNQIYLSAKAKWEQSAAYFKACTEALEESREHAKRETESLREKTAEVDRLRAQKATDDRERHAKLAALSSPGR